MNNFLNQGQDTRVDPHMCISIIFKFILSLLLSYCKVLSEQRTESVHNYIKLFHPLSLAPSCVPCIPVLGEFSPNEVVRVESVPRDSGVKLECRRPLSIPLPKIIWAQIDTVHDPHPREVKLTDRITQTDDGKVTVYT